MGSKNAVCESKSVGVKLLERDELIDLDSPSAVGSAFVRGWVGNL